MRYRDVVVPNQKEPIPGREADMVVNDAGGVVFRLGLWERLRRFLILGSDMGTYYVSARDLTKRGMATVMECAAEDPCKTADIIAEVSHEGRAPSVSPAIFAYAVLARQPMKQQDKEYVFNQFPLIIRTASHLFEFMADYKAVKGSGSMPSGLKRVIKLWYNSDPKWLAYQMVKYQQRQGWSHADVIKQARVTTEEPDIDMLLWHAVQAPKGKAPTPENIDYWKANNVFSHGASDIITDFYTIRQGGVNLNTVLEVLGNGRLPWEAVPAEWLGEPRVWQALVDNGLPMTALVRNLGRMTANGALMPMDYYTGVVVDQLADRERIIGSRLHPISILTALCTYQSGSGMRGKLAWSPIPAVVQALNKAFYLAFDNVEPSGKRMLVAVDMSGSMGYPVNASGMTVSQAAAAMAMAVARTEQRWHIMGFDSEFKEVGITPGTSLEDAVGKVQSRTFGTTDCSVPVRWAIDNRVEVDVFVILTDNETYKGREHVSSLLERYRDVAGIQAKMAVVGMTATDATIADPNDVLVMDVVGFDPAVPQVISAFAGDL